MNHFEKRIGKDDIHEKWHFEQLWPYLKNFENKEIIDVGCGRGLIASKLKTKNKVVGLDLLKDNPYKIRKIISDAPKKFPVKNNEFSVVVSSHYLEHSSDPETTLNEIFRVLKKGGDAFILVPNEYTWRNKFDFLLGKPIPSHKIEAWGHKCLPTVNEWKEFINKTFKNNELVILPDKYSEGLLWKLSRLLGSKIDNAHGFLFICKK